MKSLILLLLGLVVSIHSTFAQKPGFYGKRFILQVGLTGHHNTIRNLTFNAERNLRESTQPYKTKEYLNQYQFSGGFYGNFGYQIKKRFALSLDFQYYKSNKYVEYITIPIDDYNYNSYEGQIKYSVLRIMPRIELASAGSIAPTGLVHLFGFGVEIINPNTKNQKLYNLATPDSMPEKVDLPHMSKSYSLVLMYGLEYRHALSKNVSLNFGAFAHLNIPFIGVGETITNSYVNYNNYNYQIGSKIQESRLANVFSVRTGIVFTL